MGWVGSALKIAANLSGLFTEEARRKRLKHRIAKLERKRDKLFEKPSSIKSARKLNAVLSELQSAKRELQGD